MKEDFQFNNNFKVCGQCGKMKPISEFIISSGRISWQCRKCSNKNAVVRKNILKLRIAKFIYDKNLQENGFITNKYDIPRCNECNHLIIIPPNIEIHHPDEKTVSWRDVLDYSYEKAIKKLMKDYTELLCSNCHAFETAHFYKKYKELIMNIGSNLIFNMDPHEIDSLIDRNLFFLIGKEKRDAKYWIKKWIIKYFIFHEIYGGKCVGCEETVDIPAVEFHHRDLLIKTMEWLEMWSLDVRYIIDCIISEDCVPICNNCHEFIHSRFNEFAFEIFSLADKIIYGRPILIEYDEEIKNNYNIITNRIRNFNQLSLYNIDNDKLDISLRVKDIAKVIIAKYSRAIDNIIKGKNFNEFTRRELINEIGDKADQTVADQIKKFEMETLIEKVEIPIYTDTSVKSVTYKLTEKGREFIYQVIGEEDILYNFRKVELNKIKNYKVELLIVIYELIAEKEINEFTLNELIKLIKIKYNPTRDKEKIFGHLRNIFHRTLIPEKWVSKIDNQRKLNKWNIYRLTNKTLEFVKNLLL